jgi:Lon protease-like protein
MADEQTAVHVNFGRPMPVFPLDSVTLLPQQVLPLHIFEPRYRQMIDGALDASGQIAMAVFEGNAWPSEYAGRPPIRPAVCIGQIVEHEKLPDGRYNVFLQGVCRARIVRELEPDGERMYRAAVLEPLGLDDPNEAALDRFRRVLESDLAEGDLAALSAASTVLEYVQNEAVPSPALLELVAFALVQEPGARYRLLAEGDPDRRLDLVAGELDRLRTLVRRARAQRPEDWPKGLSWN